MKKNKGTFEPQGLLIAYKELGTISVDEFRQAILADLQALNDIYNVQYVKEPRLKIIATNEYGEQIKIRRPTGGFIYYMDTHHYRPSCRDYDL